jgi:riboflavin kinase/FMN adenylyltransferase
MIVHDSLPEDLDDKRPSVCAIGTFDGVHLGHRRIIDELNGWAADVGGQSVILTFSRNPQSALRSDAGGMTLTAVGEKLKIFEALRIDRAVVIEFNAEFARIDPEDFIRNHLVPSLKPVGLVLGPDHRFGHGRRGGKSLLADLAIEFGFEVRQVPGVSLDGETVSSTRVRRLLETGDVESANRCLDRPYRLSGRVVRGDNRGEKLGYPTANIEPEPAGKVIPPDGVYAVRVDTGDRLRGGLMYVGSRPTFKGDKRSIEVHLFDFESGLYEQSLEVLLLERIRGDQTFPDARSLIERMKTDEKLARTLLERKYFKGPDAEEVSPA